MVTFFGVRARYFVIVFVDIFVASDVVLREKGEGYFMRLIWVIIHTIVWISGDKTRLQHVHLVSFDYTGKCPFILL